MGRRFTSEAETEGMATDDETATSPDRCAAAPGGAVLAECDIIPGGISNAPDGAELAVVPGGTCVNPDGFFTAPDGAQLVVIPGGTGTDPGGSFGAPGGAAVPGGTLNSVFRTEELRLVLSPARDDGGGIVPIPNMGRECVYKFTPCMHAPTTRVIKFAI